MRDFSLCYRWGLRAYKMMWYMWNINDEKLNFETLSISYFFNKKKDDGHNGAMSTFNYFWGRA